MDTAKLRRRGLATASAGMLAALGPLLLLWPTAARAHFVLNAPACYSVQAPLGSPQKSAPCGQADPGQPVMPTGAVTTYHQGDTISVTFNETVFHPGHYRVSIAADQGSLPADPPVTPAGTPCGSTVIDPSPKLPVVADGVLVHMAAFTGPQTVKITLPPTLTCTNCVLQVTEFMSNHMLNNPGGCFYHHCATVNILPVDPIDGGMSSMDGGTSSMDGGSGATDAGASDGGSGPSDDGGAPPMPDAAMSVPPPPPPADHGCQAGAAPLSSLAPAVGLGLLSFALLVRRRRRRA